MSAKTDKQIPASSINKATRTRGVQSPAAQSPGTFARAARSWFLASALYDGVEDEDLEQIKTLLEEKKADPNKLLPEYGITPFHLIVGNSCKAFALKATRLCLLAGADPNIRSEEGLTPVHVAAIWGRVEVLEMLLKNGGDPWLLDEEHKNAFQYAQQENQWGAFNLMSTYCGLDKVIDHQQEVLTPPPCTLELKRVIVYKNDLCVEYEASSKEGPKFNCEGNSVETMTTPRYYKSISVQTVTSPEQQLIRPKQILRSQGTETEQYKECTCLDDSGEFDWCKEHFEAHTNSQVAQIIKDHRKKTIVYESAPTKISFPEQEEFSSAQGSWKRSSSYNNSDFKLNLVTELRNKLDNTNKVRLFYEGTENQNKNLGNVIHRKSSSLNGRVLSQTSKHFEISDGDGDTSNKETCQRNIGFVTDDEHVGTVSATSEDDSICNPLDIGFKIQTSHDEMNVGFLHDANNLLSDISSEVEVDTIPCIQYANIMTEDECHQEEIRVSSSTSNPYVTCNEDCSLRNTDNDGSDFLQSSSLVISGVAPLDSDVIYHAGENEEITNLMSEENPIKGDFQMPSTSTPDNLEEPEGKF